MRLPNLTHLTIDLDADSPPADLAGLGPLRDRGVNIETRAERRAA
jgi:hypothetical protein